MAILNYTTMVPIDRTLAEIQGKLARAGDSKIMQEYEEGIVTRISFMITTKHGPHAFLLPVNIEGVLASMKKSPQVLAQVSKRVNKAGLPNHAAAVAWRIMKDWIEAQLAIVEADMATLPQVFLPYMQISPDETVYSRFEKQGFPALTHKGGFHEVDQTRP